MPDRMADQMLAYLSDKISEYKSGRMPDIIMPENMSDYLSDVMLENMSN